MTEKAQREPHLDRADDPARQAQRKARRNAAALAVDSLHGGVDSFGARHQRRPVAFAEHLGDHAQQTAEQAAPLRVIEARDHRAQYAGGNERGGPQVVKRAVCGVSAEQQQPEQRENDLRDCLRRRADGNGGRRVAHAHAALGQLPHHHHGAADLAGRQQTIHRFADPA
ncbi:hypothetical protein KCU90_g4657, partial [Aureobasidium melanogenum]